MPYFWSVLSIHEYFKLLLFESMMTRQMKWQYRTSKNRGSFSQLEPSSFVTKRRKKTSRRSIGTRLRQTKKIDLNTSSLLKWLSRKSAKCFSIEIHTLLSYVHASFVCLSFGWRYHDFRRFWVDAIERTRTRAHVKKLLP